ncbi:hypothetical protein BBJ28_00020804 [Nothophytophthora sp. Chile5]|nr:hypothetical protein BBJ28_00020804 [Nothophytophthora sp. Chile5]
MNRNVWTAASDGDVENVRAFLADGGDPNAKDEYGYTPLYRRQRSVRAISPALAGPRGDDVPLGLTSAVLWDCGVLSRLDFAGDNDMDTPLHRCETVECAKLLLEHGAELNARNAEGQTPYDAAIEDEHHDLIAMYESLGAERSGSIAEGDEGEDAEFPSGVEMEG